MAFSWFRKTSVANNEFSANFDVEGLRSFLEQIIPLFTDGFGSQQIDAIISLAATTHLDETSELELKITHEGRPSKIRLAVFMDDIDSPDLQIVGPPKLITQLNDQFQAFCQERGI